MRFKTKWKKLVIATIGISIGVLLVGTGKAEAALQANLTTHNANSGAGYTYTGATLIQSIRQMETSGQTMGLNEKIKADLTTDGDSNNIDVHMMKPTEYGAVAILSASGFGNPKKLQESTIKSTTGNVTGVYMGNRWEWTVGVINVEGSVGKNVNGRYYVLYTQSDQTSAKVGDALGLDSYSDNPGCWRWHGGTIDRTGEAFPNYNYRWLRFCSR